MVSLKIESNVPDGQHFQIRETQSRELQRIALGLQKPSKFLRNRPGMANLGGGGAVLAGALRKDLAMMHRPQSTDGSFGSP